MSNYLHGNLWTSPLLIFVAMSLIVSCATVPHTGRKQLNFLPDKDLDALGARSYSELLVREPSCNDSKINEAVKRVAKRVSAAAEELDHPGFDWKIHVVDRDIPNAFCLPGGKIVVYTGILPYVKNEAGLATIIGHEIAHAVARHGGERLSQQVAIQGISSVGSEIFKDEAGKLDNKTKAIIGALGLGATIGVLLPYSRTHEMEADRIGQLYMAKAGYDPSESIRLWERMAKINKPPIPVWLSTHPADQDRIQNLIKLLPEAQKLYIKALPKYGLGTAL
ncbi:MAG: M48 family metallopeptidase [Deltaproteobacteria bacterium]|nr:M48 family metallopeptidase [Deltaproteobacteria bacterium]